VAARELHNHLARTANLVAAQMDGDDLFDLLPTEAETALAS
jgi:hypothetical protein